MLSDKLLINTCLLSRPARAPRAHAVHLARDLTTPTSPRLRDSLREIPAHRLWKGG